MKNASRQQYIELNVENFLFSFATINLLKCKWVSRKMFSSCTFWTIVRNIFFWKQKALIASSQVLKQWWSRTTYIHVDKTEKLPKTKISSKTRHLLYMKWTPRLLFFFWMAKLCFCKVVKQLSVQILKVCTDLRVLINHFWDNFKRKLSPVSLGFAYSRCNSLIQSLKAL